MAMTLRLTDSETSALRQQAEAEGRSMQETVKAALAEYFERRQRRVRLDAVLDIELPRYAEALDRLGQ